MWEIAELMGLTWGFYYISVATKLLTFARKLLWGWSKSSLRGDLNLGFKLQQVHRGADILLIRMNAGRKSEAWRPPPAVDKSLADRQPSAMGTWSPRPWLRGCSEAAGTLLGWWVPKSKQEEKNKQELLNLWRTRATGSYRIHTVYLGGK